MSNNGSSLRTELHGTVAGMCNENERKVCVCCPGPHVFARSIELDESDPWGKPYNWRIEDAVRDAVWRHDTIGRRVKITVELLPDDEGGD